MALFSWNFPEDIARRRRHQPQTTVDEYHENSVASAGGIRRRER